MSEFHSFKPLKVFSGKNMDILIESDYPIECFDAPKRFVAYLTINDLVKVLCTGYSREKLIKELYLWKENPLIFKWIKDDIKQYKEGN